MYYFHSFGLLDTALEIGLAATINTYSSLSGTLSNSGPELSATIEGSSTLSGTLIGVQTISATSSGSTTIVSLLNNFGGYSWTDGIDTFRLVVRGTGLMLDETMSLTGFGGSETVDWDNIFDKQ